MRAVIVLSGGMDSTVALYDAIGEYGAENLKAISFNYQSKHNDMEYAAAVVSCSRLGVSHDRVDLSSVAPYLRSDLLKSGGDIPEGHYAESNMKKTVVPFRNGIMLAIACGIAESWGAKDVIIGNHAGDHAIYPDCRDSFIQAMSAAMKLGTYEGVTIKSPFCNQTKRDIALIGDRLAVDWNWTYSCYKGGRIHCGRCSTCFERREAFHLAGVTDPTIYEDQTPFLELQKEYNNRLENENG